MTHSSKWLIVCVVMIAPLSGCGIGNSAYNGNIDFRGEMSIVDGEFVMEGEVVNGGVESFSDVHVSLYSSNGTAFESVAVGDLEAETSVSVRSSTIPEYVIIYSPDFWNTAKVEVDYYVRDETGNYTANTVDQRSELPVEVS